MLPHSHWVTWSHWSHREKVIRAQVWEGGRLSIRNQLPPSWPVELLINSFIKQTRMERSSSVPPDCLLSLWLRLQEALPTPKEETEQDLSPHLLGEALPRVEASTWLTQLSWLHMASPQRQAETSSPPKPLAFWSSFGAARGCFCLWTVAQTPRGSADWARVMAQGPCCLHTLSATVSCPTLCAEQQRGRERRSESESDALENGA